MFDHVGLEVSDLARSATFYDSVFFALGGRRIISGEQSIAYGINDDKLWIVQRGIGPAPAFGHIALIASGKAAVDAAHANGLAHGGLDAGTPGPRPQYGRRYYAGYLLDPDGIRVEVVSRR